MKKSLLLLVIVCLTQVNVYSQLLVTPNNNADSLAALVAGTGIIVSNATLNCPDSASGTFNGTTSNVGITSGIILTTGSVINAVGPNISASITTANNISFNDPDLMAIDTNATKDVCILQFDAVSNCDTMFVKFVFGSDEYPEFAGSTFNDAFGLFVTGQNPSGPAYVGYNMARINPTTPVSINNVNNGTTCPTAGPCINCGFYFDNCLMDSTSTVEYDGFTSVIVKALPVVPGQSYTYKYAIADAFDFSFDSGVLIQLSSLSCGCTSLLVSATSTGAGCTSNGSATALASCGTPPYSYLWSNSQTTQTATGLAAGTYTVTVTDSTAATYSATVTVNNTPFVVTSSVTPATCFGFNNGSATVNVTGGTPPYAYLWNPTGQATQTATGLITGMYSVIVSDAGGCVDTFSVAVSGAPLLVMSLNSTPSSCSTCPDGGVSSNVIGGTPSYSYLWSSGQTTPNITGLLPGNYTLCVTDTNSCVKCDSVSVSALGINELRKDISVTVSPNPFSEFTTLQITSTRIANYDLKNHELKVYDLFGKEVDATIVRAQNKFLIYRNNLNSGIYFYSIENNSVIIHRGKLNIK